MLKDISELYPDKLDYPTWWTDHNPDYPGSLSSRVTKDDKHYIVFGQLETVDSVLRVVPTGYIEITLKGEI